MGEWGRGGRIPPLDVHSTPSACCSAGSSASCSDGRLAACSGCPVSYRGCSPSPVSALNTTAYFSSPTHQPVLP